MEDFDQILFSIAEKHEGIPEFLTTIAGFLARKTDFFVGAGKGEWEKLLIKCFCKEEKKAQQIYLEKQEAESKRMANLQRKKELEENKIVEVTDEEANEIKKENER